MRSHPAKAMRLRLVATAALLATLSACAPTGTAPTAYDPTPAPQFERRIIGAVNFDFDSYRIRPDSYPLLDNVAAALNDQQLAGLRFEINGHTDISGRLDYNISLSMLRATAVVNYLAARGVPIDRMRAQGFGPLQPIDYPSNPANRRVEVVALR